MQPSESDISDICVRQPAAAREWLPGSRVLLTGYNGFLGRYFRAFLARQGCHLTLVDNFSSSPHDGVSPVEDIRWLGAGDWDFVINCAGMGMPKAYRREPWNCLDTSYTGTVRILDLAARCHARVLLFSSSEVYGDAGVVPTPEWYRGFVAPQGPRACYDEGKRVLETIAEIHKADSVIVRPFNAYGPCWLEDSRAIPSLLRAKKLGKTARIYGDGQQSRTYTYVTDCIVGCLYAMFAGQRRSTYNVGTDSGEIGAAELASLVGVDYQLSPYPDDYPGDEPRRRCPDITELRQLGFAPRVSLVDGLQATARAFGVEIPAPAPNHTES